MKMTNEEYKEYSEKHMPRSPAARHILWAFVIGGAICCLGQLILNVYSYAGLSEENAATAASITLVFAGAFLTGLGYYDDIAAVAGAGTLVPITGFANSVAAPALEFKTDLNDIIYPSQRNPNQSG